MDGSQSKQVQLPNTKHTTTIWLLKPMQRPTNLLTPELNSNSQHRKVSIVTSHNIYIYMFIIQNSVGLSHSMNGSRLQNMMYHKIFCCILLSKLENARYKIYVFVYPVFPDNHIRQKFRPGCSFSYFFDIPENWRRKS